MRNEVIKYRRKRARETLEEAKIMYEKNKLHATVNRIYYALFYLVNALLLTKELSSSKHSGVRGLFNREFVKSGVVKRELADFYNKMFEFRQRGDYEDFVEFDKEQVGEWLLKAEAFINEVDKIVAKLQRNENDGTKS